MLRLENGKIMKIDEGDAVVASTNAYNFPEITASDGRCDSSTGSVSRGLTPLQLWPVRERFFKFCSVEVLETCRLVNSRWYDETLHHWRNSFPLPFTFENGEIFMKYKGYDGVENVNPLRNLVAYGAQPRSQWNSKPYRHIRIRDSPIGSDIASNEQFQILWNAFGTSLTTLEFNRCTFKSDEEFRRIIFNCPNLQSLIIENCKFPSTWEHAIPELQPLEEPFEPNKHFKDLKIVGYEQDERKLPVSWLELFAHFPMMSSLDNRDCYRNHAPDFDSLIEAIRVSRERDDKSLPFKYFDIGSIGISTADDLYKERLSKFKELRLPLQRLCIRLQPVVDDDFFRDTFALHAKTLRELRLLELSWDPTPSFSQFPFGQQLDNLELLFISSGTFCKSLAFLKYMPNLKRLDIFNERWRTPQILSISNTDVPVPIHLKMKSLTTLTVECRLEEGDIAKLHDWMPNLTELTIALSSDADFSIVCEKWTNLKRLEVRGRQLTDEQVTGMIHKRPNITNLQNLEEFSFCRNKLTAQSVFNGFLQLPALQVLRRPAKKPVRWGEDAKKALLDRKIRLRRQ